MGTASLRLDGAFLSLIAPDAGLKYERRRLEDGAEVKLHSFAKEYRKSLSHPNAESLLRDIGQNLYYWLNGDEQWLGRLLPRLTPPFLLEACVPSGEPTALGWAFLHAPWEILADANGFLASRPDLRFAPVRRLGLAEKTAPDLDGFRLGVGFMAASPRGVEPELDYEGEESAILSALGRDVDLWVEDSGDPERLVERQTREPRPVTHLSCHGTNAWRPKDQPSIEPKSVLLMEDAFGDERAIDADALRDALRSSLFVFLSACLTSAAAEAKSAEDGAAQSLAAALVRRGVPAALGWSGSVADTAATAFAAVFYRELSLRVSTIEAAARARHALLTDAATAGASKKPTEDKLRASSEAGRRDWHLARVWLGAKGGGPVVGGDLRRVMEDADHAVRRLVDEKEDSTVAGRGTFVGRRRETQACLRALTGREREHAGVLLHGIGRLGKSSLAARLADRLRPNLVMAVAFKDFDAVSVLKALKRALDHCGPARTLLDKAINEGAVAENPERLRDVLVDLLNGPCQMRGEGRQPVLLLLDDFEGALEPHPDGGRDRVRADVRPVMQAILSAFDPQRTDSRLIVTSRTPFTLMADGRDLTRRLYACLLPTLSESSARKLSRRHVEATQQDFDRTERDERLKLVEKAEKLAAGHPGLQTFLSEKLVLTPASSIPDAEAALAQAEAWRTSAAPPSHPALKKAVESLGLDGPFAAAGPIGYNALQAATLFGTPVPRAAIEAVCAHVQAHDKPEDRMAAGKAMVDRLIDLGLFNPAEGWRVDSKRVVAAYETSPLIKGRLEALSEGDQAMFAACALPVLAEAWIGKGGAKRRPLALDYELTRLGLLAQDAAIVADAAPYAVIASQNANRWSEAADLGQKAIALLDAKGVSPSLLLLGATARALIHLGQAKNADLLQMRGATLSKEAESTEDAAPFSSGGPSV